MVGRELNPPKCNLGFIIMTLSENVTSRVAPRTIKLQATITDTKDTILAK